jgi:predicted esterase
MGIHGKIQRKVGVKSGEIGVCVAHHGSGDSEWDFFPIVTHPFFSFHTNDDTTIE